MLFQCIAEKAFFPTEKYKITTSKSKQVMPVSLFSNKTRILMILCILIFPLSVLVAQSSDEDNNEDFSPAANLITAGGRYQGDLGLQVNGYLWAPLFNIDPETGVKETNLGPGGGADLAVAYYLTANLGLGGFLDLGISAPANQESVVNYFLMVLLGPRISYDINVYTQRYNSHPLLTFPFGFGIGVSAAKFGEITNVIPVFKFDAGVYINPFDQAEWSFGLSLHYWFVTEFTKTDLSRIGNYLMIGIGFNFHSGL